MRIRRNASKLLGSAAVRAPSSPPAAPQPSVDEILCELSQSPWDLASPDRHLRDPKGEKDQNDKGNMGHGVKAGEQPMATSRSSTVTGLTTEEEEKEEKENNGDGSIEPERGQRKRKQMEAAPVLTPCRRSSGTGWKCGGMTEYPHTLCSHHLAQAQLHKSRHTRRDRGSLPPPSHRARVSQAKLETAAASGDFFYYYGAFGPWRGKSRGGARDVEKDGSDEAPDQSDHGVADEAAVASEAPKAVAVYEEWYDEEGLDKDDDDDDSEDYYDGNATAGEKVKKRGRKTIKARSLMSLL